MRRLRTHTLTASRCAMTCALVAAAGCQTYSSKPLDLATHQQAFLARTPTSEAVADFALRIAQDGATEASTFVDAQCINLAQAEGLALVFNADLRQARSAAGIAQASAENAGTWQDPTIGVDFTRVLESAGNPNEYFGTLGLTIPISGRLEIEKQRLGLEHAAELARVASKEWNTRMEVRSAWMRWVALGASKEAAQTYLAQLEELVEVVAQIEQLGEFDRIEARLFRLERSSAAIAFEKLRVDHARAELLLRQWMGLPPASQLTFVSAGIGVDAPTLAQAEPLASNPDLAIARAEYEVAERLLEEEVRAQYPDLQIGPGYGTQDSTKQFLLGLSLPIPLLNGNKSAIAQALAARESARVRAERSLEHALSRLAIAQVDYAGAVQQRSMIESEVVPLVDLQFAEAFAVARLGEVRTPVLLESLRKQREIKALLIDACLQEALSSIAIQSLVGPPSSTSSTRSTLGVQP
ncbi:MAG: TolC family protein [Phycisphaerales bacterium]|nr:TolC family protein [Phycisphaerales bacterium]